MRLRALTVSRYRTLDHIVIDPIGDGLTVISGDNEEGKSTLLAALKSALFDPCGSDAALGSARAHGALDPPFLGVELELGGQRYNLMKTFKRGGAVLEGPSGRLSGEAAEREIRTLLQSPAPKRGAADVEHWGLGALFWVEQGTTFEMFGKANERLAPARERLSRALTTELGEITGGPAVTSIEATVRTALAESLTPKGQHKSQGPLKLAIEREIETRGTLDKADAALERYEKQLGELAGLREAQATAAFADELGTAREAEDNLGGAVRGLAALQSALELARSEARSKRQAWETVKTQRDARAKMRASAEEAEQLLSEAVGEHEAREMAARAADEVAERLVQKAKEAVVGLERLRAERHLAAECRRLGDLRAALEVASTRINLEPAPGASARIGDVIVDPSLPLTISEPTVIDLVPFGRIIVRPGGGDLAGRRRAVTEAERDVDAAAAAAGVEPPCLGREALTERLGTLDEAIGQQNVACLDAQRQSEDARTTAVSARSALAGAVTTRDLRHGDATKAALTLRDDVAVLAEDSLETRSSDALDELSRADAKVSEIEKQLREADAEQLARRWSDAKEKLAEAARLTKERENNVLRLESELRGLGALGIGEAQRAAFDEWERARDEAASERRKIAAWQMLDGALQAAQRAVRERFDEPVRQRLRPLLARLVPGADALIDAATLAPSKLARNGIEEPFESLSTGTKEQIAVLVRLALARLLREHEGEAPCLILDDALVYADATRFGIMKKLLEEAAAELQIIVLTCRPNDYADMSARFVRLEDCRVSG